VSLEQLLFVALFVLVPLLNFLREHWKKRGQRPPEPAPARPPARVELPVPTTATPPAPAREPRPAPAREPRPTVQPAPVPAPAAGAAPAHAPHPRPRRLRPSDVRRGVVWMTILAPCPGLERPRESTDRATV
jgi:hypothetical protein